MARADDKQLSRYLEQVRKIPTLSREDEHELAVKVQAGDQDAADALVEANLRFVVAVATTRICSAAAPSRRCARASADS